MNPIILALIISVIVAYIIFVLILLSPDDHPWFFKPNIRKYKRIDKRNPPIPGSILFTGSSIMKFWKTLDRDMEPQSVINRSLAGSRITEIAYFTDRLIIPYEPEKVVVYAGSNDIQGIKPRKPEQVLNGFIQIVQKVHSILPDTEIFFISISPTPARIRWKHWESIQEANNLISEFCRKSSKLQFIDTTSCFLKPDGKPDRSLFKIDKIHMNSRGYSVWSSKIKPILI